MTSWNQDFVARVNFAARVISEGSSTTRRFDGCFENDDGDQVVTALYRRARKNDRLKQNIWRYLARESVVETAFKLRRVRDLKASAAESRKRANEAFEAMMAKARTEAA